MKVTLKNIVQCAWEHVVGTQFDKRRFAQEALAFGGIDFSDLNEEVMLSLLEERYNGDPKKVAFDFLEVMHPYDMICSLCESEVEKDDENAKTAFCLDIFVFLVGCDFASRNEMEEQFDLWISFGNQIFSFYASLARRIDFYFSGENNRTKAIVPTGLAPIIFYYAFYRTNMRRLFEKEVFMIEKYNLNYNRESLPPRKVAVQRAMRREMGRSAR